MVRAARAVNSEPDGRLTEEILGILHKWGIDTLGQLAALDKEELRIRLGPEAVRLWERANGTATRLLKLVQPPESFDESFEFDHEIETAEPLLFILRRFLEQLALRLSSIYLVARELTLQITFSDGGIYERVFKIPQPTNDVVLLFRMLQTHLENFKSEHPIVAVALSAQPIRPVSQQFGLFETTLRNPQQLYETLARLSALLGNDRVGTPVLEETHRSDAFRMEPFCWGPSRTGTIAADTAGATKNAGETPATTARVALRRFRPPAATSIFISEHRHRESDKVRGQIIDQSGPFLLSGNWWDEKSWARAEYDIQLENGELVRAHETAGGAWKLDGIYD
jgi:protein ImuB